MDKKNVEGLSAKIARRLPRARRGEIREALEAADESKLAELEKLSPTFGAKRGITWFTALLATLLGAVCIVLNLLSFKLLAHNYRACSVYSEIISRDLDEAYSSVTRYGGNAFGGNCSLVAFYDTDVYRAAQSEYEESFETFSAKEREYLADFEEYERDCGYVSNARENYLGYKVALARLQEPQAGEENYESLKSEYDKKIEELEGKIAEYEEIRSGLGDRYALLTESLSEYRALAEECSQKLTAVVDYLFSIRRTGGYRATLYESCSFGRDGIAEFMAWCNGELNGQVEKYRTAMRNYEDSVYLIETLPQKIGKDDGAERAESLWREVKAGLDGYFGGRACRGSGRHSGLSILA